MSTPWFGGDRTFEQQMTGLDWLVDSDLLLNKTVLDFGCAEGLIGQRLVETLAFSVYGVELLPERVKQARKIAKQKGILSHYEVADANDWTPKSEFDITLALAILHKLKDPSTVTRRLARATREMIVLRLPPATGSTIVDRRSGNVPHDIDAVLREEGFVQERAGNTGPLGEWIGVYRRG